MQLKFVVLIYLKWNRINWAEEATAEKKRMKKMKFKQWNDVKREVIYEIVSIDTNK